MFDAVKERRRKKKKLSMIKGENINLKTAKKVFVTY